MNKRMGKNRFQIFIEKILADKNWNGMYLSISLVVFALLLHWLSVVYLNWVLNDALKPFEESSKSQSAIFSSNKLIPKDQEETLRGQYKLCDGLKTYYIKVAIIYYQNYYGFSICSIVFTTLLSICIFLVGINGWTPSPLLLKTALLTSAFLASIYYFLPTVLQNETNMGDNLLKVKKFENIELNIINLSKLNNFKNLTQDSLNKITNDSIKSNFIEISRNFDFLIKIDAKNLNTLNQETFKNLLSKKNL